MKKWVWHIGLAAMGSLIAACTSGETNGAGTSLETENSVAVVLAVRHFQKEVLSLASDALDNIPVDERNISTLTLSVDQSCFDDLGDMLREFRRLVQKRVDSAKNPDRVMQLSMAFYPIARKGGVRTVDSVEGDKRESK